MWMKSHKMIQQKIHGQWGSEMGPVNTGETGRETGSETGSGTGRGGSTVGARSGKGPHFPNAELACVTEGVEVYKRELKAAVTSGSEIWPPCGMESCTDSTMRGSATE